MARKPRMGRNLNALLNGGGRERRDETPDEGAAAADQSTRVSADDATGSTDDSVRNAALPAPSAVTNVEAESPAAGNVTDDAVGDAGEGRLRMIGVEQIRRGIYQPRRVFDQDALTELADSLRAQGMVQPIVVREFGGAYELIAGERRWRAAQIAGLSEVPAIVREMADETVASVSLIENIQREDLNPLEEAQALARLCDEFGMTHASVAASIGRSRTAVSNLMRLLELHDEVKVMVDKGMLDMGHARALLGAPTADQPALAERIVAEGLTVRACEKLVRGLVAGDPDGPSAKPPADDSGPDPDIERLIEKLSGVLGAGVKIHHKSSGDGRLEIRYGSLDELDGILAHIK